ncbi:MAG: TlyA family RNA methyltransferase [Magnetococcales bacterium]|nr:TlyA family RNA methyltransferase [Magnetococcales bacterium]MBF0116378.1 TlyA family RNA methyltransferase [Magnetococcales bacterium]
MVGTLAEAVALIMDGQVLVAERKVTKPGTLCKPEVTIRLLRQTLAWVSRGGYKLAHGLAHFALSVTGAVCLDVGAATGGFTDVLLQHGAARVYALDVGYGQLAWKLAQDARVVVMDRCNIHRMLPEQLPQAVDVLTMDVSFIGLEQALPPAVHCLRAGGHGLVLIKPQFELSRAQVTPGGVIHDPALHQEAIARFTRLSERLGLQVHGATPSPVLGPKGNQEFLGCFRKPLPSVDTIYT